MSKPIIEVTNLSKSFIITHEGKQQYTALRDVVSQKAKKIFSFPSAKGFRQAATKEEFFALNDISFNIKAGDRVGIIGRNGAGKSTLLKILSRITEPSAGEITIRGRIASLLEVGTGFHPELTGRENIFLNGAILGMSRAEIRKRFDEIVDFAEVERFLDTPVKRYSSGMYVRLAFAVAAHLEPDVLIVDEVLAVGDAEFQKKCLGKLGDVSRGEGRTVLFVSHNMAAIEALCSKGILLSNGNLHYKGTQEEVINKYQQLSINSQIANEVIEEKSVSFSNFKIYENCSTDLSASIRAAKDFIIKFKIINRLNISRKSFFNFEIKNAQGVFITSIGNEFNGKVLVLEPDNSVEISIECCGLNLIPNSYTANFYFTDAHSRIFKTEFLSFEVIPSDIYGTGLLPSTEHGLVISKHNISYEY